MLRYGSSGSQEAFRGPAAAVGALVPTGLRLADSGRAAPGKSSPVLIVEVARLARRCLDDMQVYFLFQVIRPTFCDLAGYTPCVRTGCPALSDASRWLYRRVHISRDSSIALRPYTKCYPVGATATVSALA